MGVYGIVRMTALLPDPADWWGGTVMIIGAVTGVAGIAFAIAQNDIKRMLAYSSIENIGIILIGLGLALLGRSQNQPLWIVLGLGGSLLHVWNHSLFKSLLFFSAGALIHAAHTRNIDQMGGLAKQMPRVMLLCLVGAVAICALPPLNGFVSEWLIYSGLFHTLGFGGEPGFPAAAIAVVPLAMIGALAVACFVKLFAAVFLGTPRSQSAGHACDPSVIMIIPMAVMALGCLGIGLFPLPAAGVIDRAVKVWAPFSEPAVSLAAAAPLKWIPNMNFDLILLIALIVLALKMLMRKKVVSRAGTWDCGYARPLTRAQYTGSSFGQTLVSLFGFILWPKTHWPSIRGLFSPNANFKNLVPDTVLDRLLLPPVHLASRYLSSFRILQQGQTHFYVLYILITVILLLICGTMGV